GACPTTPAHIFFLRKKIPASHRARVGTSTVNLALGANLEGKERVKALKSKNNDRPHIQLGFLLRPGGLQLRPRCL
ncbi:unnamed protein product, partial [Ascophyllum nodosum]